MKSNPANRKAAHMIAYLREEAARHNCPVTVTVKRQECPVLGRSWWVVVRADHGLLGSVQVYFRIGNPNRKGHRGSVRVAGHRFIGSEMRNLEGWRECASYWRICLPSV